MNYNAGLKNETIFVGFDILLQGRCLRFRVGGAGSDTQIMADDLILFFSSLDVATGELLENHGRVVGGHSSTPKAYIYWKE